MSNQDARRVGSLLFKFHDVTLMSTAAFSADRRIGFYTLGAVDSTSVA